MSPHESNARLFLSYSRSDEPFASRLRADLQRAGLYVWMDQHDLTPGTPAWTREIKSQISSADSVVVICSPDADASDWVHKEILVAQGLKKPIYPVLAGGTSNDRPIELIDHQYVDAVAERYDDAVAKLVSAFGRVSGSRPKAVQASGSKITDPRDFSTFVGIPYGAIERDVVAVFGEPKRREPYPSTQQIELMYESSLKYDNILRTKHPAMNFFCDDEPPHRINRISLWGRRGWSGRYTLADPRLDCLGLTRKEVLNAMGTPDREESPAWIDLLVNYPIGHKHTSLYYASPLGELMVHLSRDQWLERPTCSVVHLIWRHSTPLPR